MQTIQEIVQCDEPAISEASLAGTKRMRAEAVLLVSNSNEIELFQA